MKVCSHKSKWRKGQRTCKDCHAEYMRAERESRKPFECIHASTGCQMFDFIAPYIGRVRVCWDCRALKKFYEYAELTLWKPKTEQRINSLMAIRHSRKKKATRKAKKPMRPRVLCCHENNVFDCPLYAEIRRKLGMGADKA